MTTYTVTLNFPQSTVDFFKAHGYTLFGFKGIQAGGGAASTIWLTIGGNQLYNNTQQVITWQENYYIGETSTQISGGANVVGSNPYATGPVALGKEYTYTGSWNSLPTTGPTPDAFAILNSQNQLNNFYVTQQVAAGGTSQQAYIVVQQVTGSGGSDDFVPVETVAFILANNQQQVGTIITQAFSAGVVATLIGASTSATLSYDINNGWTSSDSSIQTFSQNDSIYTALSNVSLSAKARLLSRDIAELAGTLKPNEAHSWAKGTYGSLSFNWAGVPGDINDQVSVKQGDAAVSYTVPRQNIALDKSKDGKLTNNTIKTIAYTLT
jgi:hypothetical protein